MSCPRKLRGAVLKDLSNAEEQGAETASIRRFLELDKRSRLPSQPLLSLIFPYQ